MSLRRTSFVALVSFSLLIFALVTLPEKRSTETNPRILSKFHVDVYASIPTAKPVLVSSIAYNSGGIDYDSVTTDHRQHIANGPPDISASNGDTAMPQSGAQPSSKGFLHRYNTSVIQLQSRKLKEVYDSIHSRMNAINVVRTGRKGETIPAKETLSTEFKRKLLKSMNIDDELIDDYLFDQRVDEEPDLADWDDVPPELKKYAPIIFKVVQKKMDPAYKTPCWYRRGMLKCLPYFYILGMTKCGTSDLWNKTVLHPQIIGTKKETHWWTHRFGDRQGVSFLFRYTERAISKIDIPDPKKGLVRSMKVLGDASPSTLWNNRYWRTIYPNQSEPSFINADVIATVTPGARLIVILRDPVERLFSSYYFFQRSGKRPSAIHFDEVARESVMMFEKCMENGTLRGCAYQPLDSKTPFQRSTDFTGGLYHVYLEDWMRVFPRKQLLVLELSDWHENCEKNLAKVYSLLELDFVSDDFVRMSCTQKTRVSPRKHRRLPMLETTRRLLEEKYLPYNKRLYEILHDDRFDWRYNRR